MIEVNLTEQQATELQNYVDEHMDRCYQVIDFDGEDLPKDLDDVSMYCGCHICETREHLMATFNWLRANELVDIAVV